MLSGDSYTLVSSEAYLIWVSSYFNLIIFSNLYSNNTILLLTVVHDNFMNTLQPSSNFHLHWNDK